MVTSGSSIIAGSYQYDCIWDKRLLSTCDLNSDILIQDVIPLDIGISTCQKIIKDNKKVVECNIMDVLVNRNEPYPYLSDKPQLYCQNPKSSTNATFKIYQGYS